MMAFQKILQMFNPLFALEERANREKQLKHILSQAEIIIELSSVKTGRNHPIFSFVTAISRKVFYNDIFQLNATLERVADCYTYRQDLGWLENTSPDEYTILNPLTISLTQEAVWSFSWEPARFTGCLAHIGSNVNKPFVFQPNNHFSQLLLPLGLTIVNNGNHSTACGIIKGEGFIEVKEIADNTQNCDDFYFDGTYICRVSDKSKVHAVAKFECGVLFELSRLIHAHGINFLAGINTQREVHIAKPKDAEWYIVGRDNRQILHYFLNDHEGECEVDVFEHTIIFTTTPESFGMSTTNAAEELATFIAQKFAIPLEEVICYEHYLTGSCAGEELTQRIQFKIKNGVLDDPTFFEATLPNELCRPR